MARIKERYLKLAQKYHPDVTEEGIQQDRFI
jgi:DnaJ-class molecular chaperone